MRRVLLVALAMLITGAFFAPAAKADVPLSWLETGGRIFAGGGTLLTNGVFFPGTAIYDGNQYQGLPPVQLKKGTDLEFINLDPSIVTNAHQIVSDKRKNGEPVFSSKRVDGPSRTLVITSHLKPGVYSFFCSTHYAMYGRIEITP